MRVAFAAVIACFAVPALAQVADGWDFEEGALDGWMRTGDAFANQPTFGNNIEQRRPGETPGQFGQWWIGTYENRPSPSAPVGQVQGDGPQGTLTSPPFRIQTLRIDFVIGGGNDPEREAVNLLVKQLPTDPPPRPGSLITLPDGNFFIARTETGRNNEHMEFGHWNVSALLNREARIQIVDRSSAPWGHINVDSFRGIYFTMPTAPDLPPNPDGPPSGLGTATVVVPQQAPAVMPPAGSTGSTGNPDRTVVTMPPSMGRVPRPIGRGAVVMPPTGVGAGPARPLGGSAGNHYRLVATGLRVRHQTVDDMLERDGPGDEVFVRADVLLYPDGSTFDGRRTLRSVVYGRDGQVRAGSGHQWNSADDQPGGLITNDVYPPRRPRFDTSPSRIPRDLPMVLWEGELQPGEVVLVIPSVWEWDSNEVSPAEQAWDAGLNQQGPALRFGGIWVAGDPNAGLPLQTVLPHSVRAPLAVFDEGTRPIGSTRRGGDFRSGALGVNPPGVLLTAELNDAYVATSHTVGVEDVGAGSSVISDIVLPPGAILLQLDDPPELEGKYDLELKLERLP